MEGDFCERGNCQKQFSILLLHRNGEEGFIARCVRVRRPCRGRLSSINVARPKKVFDLSRPPPVRIWEEEEEEEEEERTEKQFEQLRRWNFLESFIKMRARESLSGGRRAGTRANRQSGLKIFSLFDFGGRGERASERGALQQGPSMVGGLAGRGREGGRGANNRDFECALLKGVTQSKKGMEWNPFPSE